MKLTLIKAAFASLFAIISLTASAQFDLGVAGGLSVPNLTSGGSSGTPVSAGYSSRLGAEFGLTSEYHITKLFSIEGKLLYSSQGGKKNGLQAFPTTPQIAAYFQSQNIEAPPYLYADYKSEAKINYLRIPILAKLGWALGESPLRFSVAAGPFVGILLSARQVTRGNSNIYLDDKDQQPLPLGAQSFDATTNIDNDLHEINVGIDGNIGLSYALGAARLNKIALTVGGNYGLIPIQKESSNGRNNTGAATVLLGYSHTIH